MGTEAVAGGLGVEYEDTFTWGAATCVPHTSAPRAHHHHHNRHQQPRYVSILHALAHLYGKSRYQVLEEWFL